MMTNISILNIAFICSMLFTSEFNNILNWIANMDYGLKLFLFFLICLLTVVILLFTIKRKIFWNYSEYVIWVISALSLIGLSFNAEKILAYYELEQIKNNIFSTTTFTLNDIQIKLNYYENITYDNWTYNREDIPYHKAAVKWFREIQEDLKKGYAEVRGKVFLNKYQPVQGEPEIVLNDKKYTLYCLNEMNRYRIKQIKLHKKASENSNLIYIIIFPFLMAIVLSLGFAKTIANIRNMHDSNNKQY